MQNDAAHQFSNRSQGAEDMPLKDLAYDRREPYSSAPGTDRNPNSIHLDSPSRLLSHVPLSASDIPDQECETSIQIGDSASTNVVIARWSQRTAELKAKNKVDQSIPMAWDTMPFFSSSLMDNSRLGVSAPSDRCPFLRESAEIKAILDAVPLIQAPDPLSDDEDGKQKWYETSEDDLTIEVGSLHIPEGADKCLAGLTFVFTGQLTHLSREEGENLVKRYGGKCTTAPSKKTSFVVLGAEAGPKKLATIEQYSLRVINEKGLFALISRLPALDRLVLKEKKEAKTLETATEDVSANTTTLRQEDGLINTTTSDSQSQQQLSEQQQIPQGKNGRDLSPQAKVFLNDFGVFPPIDISWNTPEYEDYRDSVMSRLTWLVGNQESGISRLKVVHAKILDSEGTEQTLSEYNDLISRSNTARSGIHYAKINIDALCIANENNRLDWLEKWANKTQSPHIHKPPVILPRTEYLDFIDTELESLRPKWAKTKK